MFAQGFFNGLGDGGSRVLLQAVERQGAGFDFEPVETEVHIRRNAAVQHLFQGGQQVLVAQAGELALQRQAVGFGAVQGEVQVVLLDVVRHG